MTTNDAAAWDEIFNALDNDIKRARRILADAERRMESLRALMAKGADAAKGGA